MKGAERESAGMHHAASYYHQRFIKTQMASIPEVFCFFLLRFFFNVGHFLKDLLNFLQYCFCFMFWLFGHEIRRIEPAPLALYGKALTTGLLGKSSTPERLIQQL